MSFIFNYLVFLQGSMLLARFKSLWHIRMVEIQKLSYVRKSNIRTLQSAIGRAWHRRDVQPHPPNPIHSQIFADYIFKVSLKLWPGKVIQLSTGRPSWKTLFRWFYVLRYKCLVGFQALNFSISKFLSFNKTIKPYPLCSLLPKSKVSKGDSNLTYLSDH